MLHAGHEVVGLHVGDLTSLGVHPDDAFPQVEGVGQAVLTDLPGGGQSGLLHVFDVVFIQTVVGLDDLLAVCFHGGSQNVPSVGIAGAGHVVLVVELVTVGGQVLLDPGFKGAGALELAPLGADLVDLIQGQDIALDDDGLVVPLVVGAPQGGVHGTGSHTADGVVAAPALQGDHDGGAQQLGLGLGHQGKPHGQVFRIHVVLGLLIEPIELAQDILVDAGRILVVGVGIEKLGEYVGGQTGVGLGDGLSRRFGRGLRSGSGGGGAGGRGSSSAAAGGQCQDHGQCQDQRQNLFQGIAHGCSFLLKNILLFY